MAKVRGGITVKAHVQRFADALERAVPQANSFGTYNGHSPPEGPTQALDIFNPETENGYRLQDEIADFAIKNQKRFGVRYVIKWNPAGKDFIWNIERADEGWRAKATRDHSNHVHITFYATAPGPFGDVTPSKPAVAKEDQLFSKSPVHTVHIIASHSGLLLTSSGEHHGAGVIQRRSDGSLNQRWEVWGHDDGLISLVNRAGGFALDRPDYSTEAGTFLQVARTEHNAAQRWSRDSFKPPLARLWAPGTNRCMDVHMRSVDDGAGVQLWYGLAEDQDPRHQQFIHAPTV